MPSINEKGSSFQYLEPPTNEKGSGFLHLDGFKMTTFFLVQHLKKGGICRSQIWIRIAAPIQIAIIIIQTTVNQIVRGVLLVASGMLSLNRRVIKDGLKDLISIPVQIIALPIIALISLFYPDAALLISDYFSENWSDPSQPLFYDFTENQVRGRIVSVVFGIFSVPISIFRNATNMLLWSFSLNFSQSVASLFLIVRDSLVNLGVAFGSLGPESVREKTFYSFSSIYGTLIKPMEEMINVKNFHTPVYKQEQDLIYA